jgi:L-threonylcarbamoyladenylate synthase
MPANPTTLDLIKITGPLVAPSANLSGKPSATTREHVEEDFGESFPVLYSSIQPCTSGIESTILIWKEGAWRLGRPGAISISALESVLGYAPSHLTPEGEAPLCPGQLYRHYAPQAHLFLESHGWQKEHASSFDAVLGFSDRIYEKASKVVSMGSCYSVLSVTYRLYAALRELDEFHLSHVFVDLDIPETSEWLPIRDRLCKAAADKKNWVF